MAENSVSGSDVVSVEELEQQNAELRARLENAQQHVAKTLMRYTRLAQVVSVLGQERDLDTTVERAAIEVAELFAADIALLILDAGTGVEIAGSWGLTPRDREMAGGGLGDIRRLAATSPVGIETAAGAGLPDWLMAYGPEHLAWAQLAVGNQPLGLIILMRRDSEPFVRLEQNELRAISHRIALAIENGILHRRMTRQLAQMHRLQELTAELAGAIEPNAVGELVATTLVNEVGVAASVVLIMRDGELTTVAHTDGSAGVHDTHDLNLPDGPWRRFPLEVGDHTVGCVAVVGEPAVGSPQHDLLMQVLGLAALALDKALLHQRTSEQARRDSLTGLLGHRVFQEMLEQCLAAEQPFSIALFDVDDFKEVNDLYGHQAGDEALRSVAQTLRLGLRAGDSVFRVGGEEFCAVLPSLTAESALAIAERARAAVAAEVLSLPHPLTVSVGIAGYPSDAGDRPALIAAADEALYASKRAGKNRSSLAADQSAPAPAPRDREGRLGVLLRKDPATVSHSIRVSSLSVEIARDVGLAADRVADVRIAAKLHDIGKIAVPDAILNKPGPLDDEEFRLIKTHPVVGAELLLSWGMDEPARIVREHHEHVDGSGYPAGLRGDEICIESRIIHVADAYVAMTVDRSYRRAMTKRDALAELLRCSGTQFDPEVVDALLAIERSRAVARTDAAPAPNPG